LLDRKSILSLGSQGCHGLQLFFNVKTKLQIDFDSDKLTALEKVNVQIRRHDPITEGWMEVENVQGLSFTVKDGNLVVEGKPIAHEGKKDVRIDKSGLRCRHYAAFITPQNRAGNGEVVTLMITCLDLGIFWGGAQRYIETQSFCEKNPSIAGPVGKLECCKVDLDGMFTIFGRLGAWHILFKCVDTSIKCIDVTRRYVEEFTSTVKTTRVVLYFSGHGYSTEDGTYLLISDENNLVQLDPGSFERNNLCIESAANDIQHRGDNSTLVLVIPDVCRTLLKSACSKNISATKSRLQFKIGKWFPQLIIFNSTSEGLPAHGAANGGLEMSQFTGILYMVLKEVLDGNPSESLELMRPPATNSYASGLVAVKDRVHRAFLDKLLQGICNIQEVDAQVPEYREGRVREAVTFKSLPFPPLPAALELQTQVNSCGINAAAAGVGGAGQRIYKSAKGKESYDSQVDEQGAGNPRGASSSKRTREDTPHKHTKGSTKHARVSGGSHAYG